MADWQYFTETDNIGELEAGWGVALIRIESGDPWRMAEALRQDGSWVETDSLERRFLRGSDDGDLAEVNANRAQALLVSWLASERLKALPARLPLDHGPEPSRGAEQEAARAELRIRAREAQESAMKRFALVPIPAGAASISLANLSEVQSTRGEHADQSNSEALLGDTRSERATLSDGSLNDT